MIDWTVSLQDTGVSHKREVSIIYKNNDRVFYHNIDLFFTINKLPGKQYYDQPDIYDLEKLVFERAPVYSSRKLFVKPEYMHRFDEITNGFEILNIAYQPEI